MSALAAAIARRAPPGLLEAKTKERGARYWIKTGGYTLGPSSTSKNVVLHNVYLPTFLDSHIHDFQRFSFSSYETLSDCNARPERPDAISWPLLKLYYSGYFAAHAIMRATGEAVLRIEDEQANFLTKFGQILGLQNFDVAAGTYHMKVSGLSNVSDITLTKLQDGRGAHDVFWRRFKVYLEDLSKDIVAARDPDASALIARIIEIQELLGSKNSFNGTWLSTLRNEVNYQHLHDVWFPFGAPQKDIKFVGSIKYKASGSIRLDGDAEKQPLNTFCSGCLFISSLNYEVTTHLVSAASKNNRFVKQWARLQQLMAK